MDRLVLPDSSWRSYEYELVDQFLGPGFDPENPPVVADLLVRDNIPPQDPEAARKVDRYVPAAASGAVISTRFVEGNGRDAHFMNLDRRGKLPSYSVFDTIGIDVRRAWMAAGDQLRQDPTARLSNYLRIYNERTLAEPLPPDRIVTAHHILSGGQLATEVGGFLGAIATVIGDIEGRTKRLEICHSLVTVELGRAVVHMATTDCATPRWVSITKLQLLHNRAGTTLRDKNGERLWQGGQRPEGTVTPKLTCPIHSHGALRNIIHASVNEAFERDAL